MYENFLKLLKSKGCSAYQVSKATGIAQSTLSDWKKGKSVPKADKMQKIADFFDVSVEFLMKGSEGDEGKKYYLNDETANIAQEIFENKDLRMLFDVTRKTSPQRLKAYYNMIRELEKQERGED